MRTLQEAAPAAVQAYFHIAEDGSFDIEAAMMAARPADDTTLTPSAKNG